MRNVEEIVKSTLADDRLALTPAPDMLDRVEHRARRIVRRRRAAVLAATVTAIVAVAASIGVIQQSPVAEESRRATARQPRATVLPISGGIVGLTADSAYIGGAGTISRVDRKTNKAVAESARLTPTSSDARQTSSDVKQVELNANSIWVNVGSPDEEGGELIRLDPISLKETQQIKTPRLWDFRLIGNALWTVEGTSLVQRDSQTGHRLGSVPDYCGEDDYGQPITAEFLGTETKSGIFVSACVLQAKEKDQTEIQAREIRTGKVLAKRIVPYGSIDTIFANGQVFFRTEPGRLIRFGGPALRRLQTLRVSRTIWDDEFAFSDDGRRLWLHESNSTGLSKTRCVDTASGKILATYENTEMDIAVDDRSVLVKRTRNGTHETVLHTGPDGCLQ